MCSIKDLNDEEIQELCNYRMVKELGVPSSDHNFSVVSSLLHNLRVLGFTDAEIVKRDTRLTLLIFKHVDVESFRRKGEVVSKEHITGQADNVLATNSTSISVPPPNLIVESHITGSLELLPPDHDAEHGQQRFTCVNTAKRQRLWVIQDEAQNAFTPRSEDVARRAGVHEGDQDLSLTDSEGMQLNASTQESNQAISQERANIDKQPRHGDPQRIGDERGYQSRSNGYLPLVFLPLTCSRRLRGRGR